MTENNGNNQLNLNEQNGASACGPGCDCGGEPKGGHFRMMAGVIILTLTGVLAARAVVKENAAPAAKPASGYSSGLALEAPVPAKPSIAGTEIASLNELNQLAVDTDAVYVYVPGKAGTDIEEAPIAMLNVAVEAIKANKIRVGVFTLTGDSAESAQLGAQMELPGVLALVKGRGMVPVSGEITKDKLVQAFVAASSASGCGAGGCGPSGCN